MLASLSPLEMSASCVGRASTLRFQIEVHEFSVQQEGINQQMAKLVVFLVFLVNTTISLVCSFAKIVIRTNTMNFRIKLHAKFVWLVSSQH